MEGVFSIFFFDRVGLVVDIPVLFMTESIEERLFLSDGNIVNICSSALSAFGWATNQLYTIPVEKLYVLVVFVLPCLIRLFVDDITITVLTGVDRQQSLPIGSQVKRIHC